MDAASTSLTPDQQTGQSPSNLASLRRFRVAIAGFWTVVIMMLCWLPGSMVAKLEDGSSWFKVPDLDKVVHAGIFVGFSILWVRVWSSPRRFAWVALGGFVLAIITELVQKLPVVGRDGSIADTLTDAAGVLVGLAVAPVIEPVARFLESRITAYRLDAYQEGGE